MIRKGECIVVWRDGNGDGNGDVLTLDSHFRSLSVSGSQLIGT